MGSLLTLVTRAAAFVVVLVLAGCGGLYSGMADLSQATAPTQPIKAGAYLGASDEENRIELDDEGGYRVINSSSEELRAKIFGPVAGVYVAQLAAEKEQAGLFAYAIIRVDAEGVQLAEDAADVLGTMLFSRLGIAPPPDGAAVSGLTDNAFLNWALLQEFIVKHRDALDFRPLYRPAAK